MKVQHTPGPWVIYTEPKTLKIRGPYREYITQWTTESAGSYKLSDETRERMRLERIANANLISAAPDLLKALKVIVEAGGIGPEGMFEDAREAIAKAEGGAP